MAAAGKNANAIKKLNGSDMSMSPSNDILTAIQIVRGLHRKSVHEAAVIQYSLRDSCVSGVSFLARLG